LKHWFKLWRIKINENKSHNITFTLCSNNSPPVFLNEKIIPKVNSVKYLNVHLDKRLIWVRHIKIKRKSLNIKLHKLRPLLSSNILLSNKLLIYKQIIHPDMTYDIQLWGSAKKSNVNIFQAFQSINLRLITKAPWYVSKFSLHRDLKICTIPTLARIYYSSFHAHTHNHPNPLISNISSAPFPTILLDALNVTGRVIYFYNQYKKKKNLNK